MGKRSNFERNDRDYYPTPYLALLPLLSHLPNNTKFCEPCAGDGRLVKYLTDAGHKCIAAWDVEPCGENIDIQDATKGSIKNVDCFITNPPWDRTVLHKIIYNLSFQYPTWLLFDADWMHTRQSNKYWQKCFKIISIGRVKWIENSLSVGKDNCCWYGFNYFHNDGPQFIGRD